MPVGDILTPLEASHIASNSYFALKDWINGGADANVESIDNVRNRVIGPADAGSAKENSSLAKTDLEKGKLTTVFAGKTGIGTNSGFGYVLHCKKGDRRHVVIATRGTRPQLGSADILTDLRGAMTSFGDFGPVHKGFKTTFDSIQANLAGAAHKSIMDADVVHCVGHSLGGGVATLVAAHYAKLDKLVKLYTFGCPRVGAFGTYSALQKEIGKEHIFRVAHDLDPFTLLATFPYIHVLPTPGETNNFTIPSPTGHLFSTDNHEMTAYIKSVAAGPNPGWNKVWQSSKQVDHDNCALAKVLLYQEGNPGWVQYASAKTLGILFKLFSHVLRGYSTALILNLSAADLLAEMLHNGLCKAVALSEQVFQLLRHAAVWAGITMAAGAKFTEKTIGLILQAMLARLKAMAAHALNTVRRNMVALPLVVAGGFILSSSAVL